MSQPIPTRLVYFAPVGRGGLSTYAVHQASAISARGVATLVVGRKHLEAPLGSFSKKIAFIEIPEIEPGRDPVQRALSMVRQMRQDIESLHKALLEFGATQVLMASYVEYLSPFWAGRMRLLLKQGLRIGTVVHDPVRDFHIGPLLWHRWSISEAYSFVNVAYVHDDNPIDTGWPGRKITVKRIPHGLYRVPCPLDCVDRDQARRELGITKDAVVILSFGHIRDGKNLDLLIRILKELSSVHLLVVGQEQSSSQRRVSWYQNLACELGVAQRCHWVNEFVDDEDVHRYFIASDIASILYSKDFHSASGVLNNAAQFELPVLCSSGGGPLRKIVDEYALGKWVRPDDLDSATEGLSDLVSRLPLEHRWANYRRENDWDRNAKIVLDGLSNFDTSVSQ